MRAVSIALRVFVNTIRRDSFGVFFHRKVLLPLLLRYWANLFLQDGGQNDICQRDDLPR